MVYGVHGSSSEGVLLAYCANKNPYRHQQSKLCTPYFVLKKATQTLKELPFFFWVNRHYIVDSLVWEFSLAILYHFSI